MKCHLIDDARDERDRSTSMRPINVVVTWLQSRSNCRHRKMPTILIFPMESYYLLDSQFRLEFNYLLGRLDYRKTTALQSAKRICTVFS